MPTYEYLCFEHGRFEKFLKMSDFDAPMKCPKCGYAASKTIPTVALIIKEKPWKRYGTGAASVLKEQTGVAPGYFIPSEGFLEQAEVDYLVEAQEEKQQNYVPKAAPRQVRIMGDKTGYDVEVKE